MRFVDVATVHTHVNDPKRCLELSPSVCLTQTTDGYLVHFDPPQHGFRQVGSVRIAPGAWTQEGTYEAGDLTIKPSIRVSGGPDGTTELLHGWVVAGAWVDA